MNTVIIDFIFQFFDPKIKSKFTTQRSKKKTIERKKNRMHTNKTELMMMKINKNVTRTKRS